VSIDLWKPYKTVIEKLMPKAQIVADRFHVMKQINEELNARRNIEKTRASQLKDRQKREEILAGLIKSKSALLKKKEKLNQVEKDKLKEVEQVAPDLMAMYQKKEDFRAIFEDTITGDEAFWTIVDWTESSYQYFPKSCQTIKRWIDEIVAPAG
jgi:transposase